MKYTFNIIGALVFSLLALTVSAQSRDKYYPFEVGADNEVSVTLNDTASYGRYLRLFVKYGYSGNGYCWEGHIVQILEKLDPAMLKHLRMDPEAGMFLLVADDQATQLKFVKLLTPIFADEKKLAVWIKKADHSRISD